MFEKVVRIIKKIPHKIFGIIYAKLNPITYAKWIGVNVGDGCHIYG